MSNSRKDKRPSIFHHHLIDPSLVGRIRLPNSLPVRTLALWHLMRTRHSGATVSATYSGTVFLHIHGKTGMGLDDAVAGVRLVSAVDACLCCARGKI
jgi:hypothetical protein